MPGRVLILGAGYVGAALAERLLTAGDAVTLADDWSATRREQLAGLERSGARIATADVRDRAALDALLAESAPDRVVLLAAQASRPLSWRDPATTEATNLVGPRLVAEAVAAAGGPSVLFGSSLHVYGPGLRGEVGPERPYGPQGDLAHLSKVYAELCLRMYAEREGFALGLLRLGIVYGPSPVEHDGPDSVTVVDKFRRLAAADEPLPLDDGGRATIGVVHVDDVARILGEHAPRGVEAHNVAAETVTVGEVAALAQDRPREGAPGPAWTVASPFAYERTVAEYLRA